MIFILRLEKLKLHRVNDHLLGSLLGSIWFTEQEAILGSRSLTPCTCLRGSKKQGKQCHCRFLISNQSSEFIETFRCFPHWSLHKRLCSLLAENSANLMSVFTLGVSLPDYTRHFRLVLRYVSLVEGWGRLLIYFRHISCVKFIK